MKIAISCEQNNLNSPIDERFGRCAFFYIHDTSTQKGEFFENPYINDNQGVGGKVVEFLASKNVNEVYVVEVGGKAQPVLNSLNIKVHITPKEKTVESIINQII